MVKDTDIKDAIRSGASTSAEIAEYLDVDPSTARRYLKQYVEADDSTITRAPAPEGKGFVYGIEESAPDVGDELPVFSDRDYTLAEKIPAADEAVYVETDGGLSDIQALIDARHETGQLPRFKLTGPPGTGKTTLARSIGAARQWPVINVQFTASMRDAELLGSPHIIGGESVFVDGPLVKALLCSQERPVIVVLDEVNRAPFHRKSTLQSFLDHRAAVELTLRGGETISGEGIDLVTIATMNEGAEYETFDIDPAERRRHSNTYEVPYLGLVDVDREVRIAAERTPVDQGVAHMLVTATNEVRKAAISDKTSPIDSGIATSIVLEWAKTAAGYRAGDRPDPIRRAADSVIVEAHHSDRAAEEVRAILFDALRSHHEQVAVK